ncbi:MAG TPA: ubiquinone biosynthesis regulatory protein kinase UbiB [Steroidobacteraceae bacterium]|nr:ubiquinone biosynthesis regulatory protein kinase UbiB [Steroidobacteraceae bacterium]
MISLPVAGRLIEIQRVLVRHGLDEFVTATHLYRPLRFLYFLQPSTWFERRRGASRGERLRLACEELGPIFIKFGQAISTRRDLLPADIADELAKLQDRVPPFPAEAARAAIERSLGEPVSEVFGSFESEPLAAASIAQVHTATLKDGREVIVKVLRPGMHEVIRRDLEVLYALAELALRYVPDASRLRPVEVVAEYDKTIMDELDLMREAANAAQLKRNFAGSPLLYVPEVHFGLCRTDVLVMERIRGVQISDVARLRELKVNIQKLAENGVELFFTQLLQHNFFHADMHPGNIFVLTEDPENPRYAAVDFGIVGALDPKDLEYLAGNFLAFFDRDYHRVAELHVESGWVPPGTRVHELEGAVRTVCEPIFDKPLSQISFGIVLLRLFETARRFRMEIQPQLVLLQKTLLNIEGLGRQLYPELDLWKTAQPLLRAWSAERANPRRLIAEGRRHLPELIATLRATPPLLRRLIREAEARDSLVATDVPRLETLRAELRAGARRRDQTIVASAVLVLGGLWLAMGAEPWWTGAALLSGTVAFLLMRR